MAISRSENEDPRCLQDAAAIRTSKTIILRDIPRSIVMSTRLNTPEIQGTCQQRSLRKQKRGHVSVPSVPSRLIPCPLHTPRLAVAKR